MNYWWLVRWRLLKEQKNQAECRTAAAGRGYWRRWRQDKGPGAGSHISTPFNKQPPNPPYLSHVPAPPPSGVLLCCQITKWLFACYKQRKQILYRYYIYIEMFFPHWEVCIGTDIALIHTLRQYSFKAPQSYIRLHTCTLLLTVTCGKTLKETHFLSCW